MSVVYGSAWGVSRATIGAVSSFSPNTARVSASGYGISQAKGALRSPDVRNIRLYASGDGISLASAAGMPRRPVPVVGLALATATATATGEIYWGGVSLGGVPRGESFWRSVLPDEATRLRRMLPESWFPQSEDDSPVLGAILHGLSTVFKTARDLLNSVIPEMRLTTATGGFLEMFAHDFFDDRMRRRTFSNGGFLFDEMYRSRIKFYLFPLKGTIPALVAAVNMESGQNPYIITEPSPVIVELRRPMHTGAYASLTVSPVTNNPSLMGYSISRFPENFSAFDWGLDPYDEEQLLSLSMYGVYGSMVLGTDFLVHHTGRVNLYGSSIKDIEIAIDMTRPVGAQAWTRLFESERYPYT